MRGHWVNGPTARKHTSGNIRHIMEKATCSHLKLLALLALLGVAALAGGCAAGSALSAASVITSPSPSALEIHNNTDVRLEEKNFIVIKTNVMGQSKGFSLLGVVTIVPAKFTKAMSRLYLQAEMQPGRPQTLTNLIMEKDATYLILFSIPRTAIRADVIEFIPATPTDLQPRAPPFKP
jgi:hypothetical protein